MRTGLRLVALAIFLGTVVFWFFGGPNLGWTKSYVTVKKVDPVTEQEYEEKIDRFVPGVDFVAAGTGGALLLFGLSFCFNRRQSTGNT